MLTSRQNSSFYPFINRLILCKRCKFDVEELLASVPSDKWDEVR